jgi:hypothetical protein
MYKSAGKNAQSRVNYAKEEAKVAKKDPKMHNRAYMMNFWRQKCTNEPSWCIISAKFDKSGFFDASPTFFATPCMPRDRLKPRFAAIKKSHPTGTGPFIRKPPGLKTVLNILLIG